MSKAGEKDQQGPDLDGRIMALEQHTRGLSARICALERSFSGDHVQQNTGKPLPEIDQTAQPALAQDMDDFVPAGMTLEGPDRPAEYEARATGTTAEKSDRPAFGRIDARDLTGLIAGAIMVVISALLFTNNIEVLKNPWISLGFGLLLLGAVCARSYLR